MREVHGLGDPCTKTGLFVFQIKNGLKWEGVWKENKPRTWHPTVHISLLGRGMSKVPWRKDWVGEHWSPLWGSFNISKYIKL